MSQRFLEKAYSSRLPVCRYRWGLHSVSCRSKDFFPKYAVYKKLLWVQQDKRRNVLPAEWKGTNCLRKSLELRVVDDGRLLGKHGLCRLLGMRLGADDRVRCLFRWGFDPHSYMIMIPILEKLGFLLEMLKSVCSTFGLCITTFWGCVVSI